MKDEVSVHLRLTDFKDTEQDSTSMGNYAKMGRYPKVIYQRHSASSSIQDADEAPIFGKDNWSRED